MTACPPTILVGDTVEEFDADEDENTDLDVCTMDVPQAQDNLL